MILWIQYAIVKRNADISEKSGAVKTDASYGFTVLTGDFDNNGCRVLGPYSDSMLDLLANGYDAKLHPSGHDISDKFGRNNGGSVASEPVCQY